MVWCGLRTLPYLGQYGFNALRDAAVAGYGLIGIFTAAAILGHRERLWQLVRRYTRFAPFFLLLITPLFLLFVTHRHAIPHWPWADEPVLLVKAGDVAVMTAGVVLLYLSGLTRRWWVWLTALMWLAFLSGSLVGRGGMLAFTCAMGAIAVLMVNRRGFWQRAGVLVVAALALQVVLSIGDFRFAHLRHPNSSVRR